MIDTLSAGLSVMMQNPWLLLLPILFDLFYWFAPPLILGPELVTLLLTPFDPEGANATLFAARPELAPEFNGLYGTLKDFASSVNLWQFFVSSYLFWPSALVSQFPDASAISLIQERGWQLTTPGNVVSSVLGLAVIGLFVNVFWLHGVAISLQTRETKENPLIHLARAVRPTLKHSLLLLTMGLIFLMIFMGGLFPLSFILAVIMLLSPGVGACLYSFAIIGILWLLFWLAVHLYFTVAAMIMQNKGLLQAPRLSIQIVRRFFRSGLGFVLLCTILTWGFQIVWGSLNSDLGKIISITGNAALGTAIAAAMMIFFDERYSIIQEELKSKE